MPARLRDIIAALKRLGITVDNPRSGSHFMARREGTRPYPLAAHNGTRTEISDRYINGLCEHFGLDVEEFKKQL